MRTKVMICALISALLILFTAQIVINYMRGNKVQEEVTQHVKKADYCILVEIEDKTLYLLENGKCVKRYPVSSGAPDLPSPIGFWKIIEKGDWGEGFGGRWMGLNVPWGKYGIHGTLSPESIGTAASHGCIRMYTKQIKELYDIVPIGTPVVIVNGCFGPFGSGFANINIGDRGADVLAIQIRLKDLGYYKGWPSGIYEDNLKYAVHKFQKDNGLQVKNMITKVDYLKMGFRDFE